MFCFRGPILRLCLMVVGGTFAGALVAEEPDGGDAAGSPPNIIVMIADDLAWNDLGCYGHPSITTPNIDAIARAGMRFDNAMLTCSSCSPSRISLLTGRYPSATGARELHMPAPESQVLVSQVLRDAGYWTVAAGKWHLGGAVVKQFDSVLQRNNGPSGCERWVEALRDRPQDRPFFAWLAAFDPHRGYTSGTFDPPHNPAESRVPPYLVEDQATREDLAMYYDEVARFDKYVGSVVAELDRQGIAEQTMLVVMSDNGRPFPRCKTTVYDSGVRTPLIIKLPGKVAAGSVTQQLASSVDLAPTFAELAGTESATFQGVSLLPLLSDPAQSVRRYAFSEHNWHDYQACERSVRSMRFRYIRNDFPELPGTPPADAVRSPSYRSILAGADEGTLSKAQRHCLIAPRPPEELYVVAEDPHQLTNVAADAQYAKDLRRLRDALAAWQQRIDDPVAAGASPDRFDRRSGKRLPPSR